MSDHPMPNADDNSGRPDGPADGPATVTTNADALREAERQRDEYLNQLKRTQAEFVNYQKRARAQADTDRTYAIVPLAIDLIGVLDNFDRAIEAAQAHGGAGMVEGIEMVRKQLFGTLAKHGIEPIPALGQPFDPNLHEAITQVPDAEHPEGTVVAELGKGYRLLDRVLRPAKVAVSVRPRSSGE